MELLNANDYSSMNQQLRYFDYSNLAYTLRYQIIFLGRVNNSYLLYDFNNKNSNDLFSAIHQRRTFSKSEINTKKPSDLLFGKSIATGAYNCPSLTSFAGRYNFTMKLIIQFYISPSL